MIRWIKISKALPLEHKNMTRSGFVVISTVFWLIDRVTKVFALEYLSDSLDCAGGFCMLAVYRNYGIAFGILQDYPLVCRILALSWAVLLVFAVIKYQDTFLTLSAAFLLAGALGNLADRWIYGYVVDWIHFIGYVNLADILLCLGASLSFLNFSRVSGHVS